MEAAQKTHGGSQVPYLWAKQLPVIKSLKEPKKTYLSLLLN